MSRERPRQPFHPRGNKNAMKHRCFTAETIGLRKEMVSLARKAQVHGTDADASRLDHRDGALTIWSTLPSLRRASLFARDR
jgi:hypothetical protein